MKKLEVGNKITALFGYTPSDKNLIFELAEVKAIAEVEGDDCDGFADNNAIAVLDNGMSIGLAFTSRDDLFSRDTAIWFNGSLESLSGSLRKLANEIDKVTK